MLENLDLQLLNDEKPRYRGALAAPAQGASLLRGRA
jgi:hypothetical protein